MDVRQWVTATALTICCSITILQTQPVYAQGATVPDTMYEDSDCIYAESQNVRTNTDIVNRTFPIERDYNHKINPGSADSTLLDALAACTGLNFAGFAFGFTLPSIEAIIAALINQLIRAACSAIRRQISQITSIFPSIPCYRGCYIGYGANGVANSVGGPEAAASSASESGNIFSGETSLSPTEQWDAVRPLFQAPTDTAPAATGTTDMNNVPSSQ